MSVRKSRTRPQRTACTLALAATLGLMLASCEKQEESYEEDPQAVARARAAKVNPASLNCKQAGGTLLILKRGDGGEYGICRFEDGRECEEWAMFLSFCPAGGFDVSAYTEPAARYCVLRGGKYVTAADAASATCRLPGGVTCGADDFYAGRCETRRR